MLVLGLVVGLFVVLLWNLVLHPIRSAISMARMLCGVLGIWQLLSAVGELWRHEYLLAGGYLVVAIFLLWCRSKLAASPATSA